MPVTNMVHVYFLPAENKKIAVGRLLLKERKIFFEYDNDFVKMGIELSPFKLPLSNGVAVAEDNTFSGLFGVFNDSLPDGWGKLLLDRKLMHANFNPHHLSPLDRLCYVGHQGMGALIYEPEIAQESAVLQYNLDEIAGEIIRFQQFDEDDYVEDLLMLNGSSAGARPKVMLAIGGEDWLIKFRSSIDRTDIGGIEYAYHLMAAAAKLDVPDAQLFPAKKGHGYFGVKRFDRSAGKRIHMHSMSGLLHIDHRIANLDYEMIMRVTHWLTRDVQQCEKQFRAAVFNVFSHNRDDHAKNFSFLMDEKGKWIVSPAYDLTFSSGPNGEHSTMVMGEGKSPTLSHLRQLAAVANIKSDLADAIIDEVCSAIAKWPDFAEQARVSQTSRKMIQQALQI